MQKLLSRTLFIGLFFGILSMSGYCAAYPAQVEDVCPPGFKVSSGYAAGGAVDMNASKLNASDAKGALVDREIHIQYSSIPRQGAAFDNVSLLYQENQKKQDAAASETRTMGMTTDTPVSTEGLAGGTLYLRKQATGTGTGSSVITYSGNWIGVINNHFLKIQVINVVDSSSPVKEAIQYMVEKSQ